MRGRRIGILSRAGLGALALLTVVLGAGTARAQSKVGTTFGQFLLIEPSAWATGTGNAGVGLDRGIAGVYYNPASIGRLEHWGLEFSHASWLADLSYDYAIAGTSLGRWGNLYGNLTSLGSGDIDVRTVAQPFGTGERYSVHDIALGLGYGIAISDRFAVGGQVTWIQETIWNSTAQTATFSVGTLYRVSDHGLHIGAALANFGTSAQFSGRDLTIQYDQNPSTNGDNGALPGEASTDAFAVPLLFRVGLGLPYRLTPELAGSLALDAYHPSDNTESVSAGAELGWKGLLAVRAGWQNAFLQDAEGGLTLGVGVAGAFDDVLNYRLDYAWADHGRLGSAQRLSLGLGFGFGEH